MNYTSMTLNIPILISFINSIYWNSGFTCSLNKDFIIGSEVKQGDLWIRALSIFENNICYVDDELQTFMDCYRYCNAASNMCVGFVFRESTKDCGISDPEIDHGLILPVEWHDKIFIWNTYLLQMPSQDINECLSDPCQNGGECIDTTYDFMCLCEHDFTGHICQSDMSDGCWSSPCMGRGNCLSEESYYTCECYPGYTGYNCETDLCFNIICFNGGIHLATHVSCECSCLRGFLGEHCETEIDECLSAPCQHGGTCLDNVNEYTCQCSPGYSDMGCSTDIDECLSGPCQNAGICVDAINEYICECLPGYDDETCSTEIDECLSNPCLNAGVCVNGVNEFTCQCLSGYGDVTCSTDIDECLSSPCQNGGDCLDRINGYTCECLYGFGDVACTTDYCSMLLCSNYGTATAIENGCTCTCLDGFSGTYCHNDDGHSYDVVNALTVDNGYFHGNWAQIDVCPSGSYAAGIRVSTDTSGTADYWGVDTVQLTCKHVVTHVAVGLIQSHSLGWGVWQEEANCPDGWYITKFRMFSQTSQGGNDDSATNNFEVECRGNGLDGVLTQTIQANGITASWASWGSWSLPCPNGQAVVALQVRYEPDQGFFSDDTAIGDAKMFCSSY